MKLRPFHKSLRGKILLCMLAVSLVPVLFVGLVSYLSLADSARRVDRGLEASRNRLIAEVAGRNAAWIARSAADEIDAYLRERIWDVMAWASAPVVVDAARAGYQLAESQGLPKLGDQELEARLASTRSLDVNPAAGVFLRRQIDLLPGFVEVFFTDAHGYNVAVSNRTSDFIQSDEPWWQKAWEQGMAVGQVKYDDSASTLAMDISMRIADLESGKPLGVMKAVLGVDRIQQVADNAAIHSAAVREEARKDAPRGKDAYQVCVLTAEGLLLAETATRHDPSRIMTTAVKAFAAGEPGAEAGQKRAESSGLVMNAEAVTAFVRTAGAEFYRDVPTFEGFAWTVTVMQPTALALAPLAGLGDLHQILSASASHVGRILLAAAILGAAGAAVLAVILARGITRPLAQLAVASEKVSRGDSSARIDLRSDDELGDLGASFERLVTAVRFLTQEVEEAQRDRRSETVS